MNEFAIWLGSFFCEAGIAIGVRYLGCYDQLSLRSLGWAAIALLPTVAALVGLAKYRST
jgi:hypothetical protein